MRILVVMDPLENVGFAEDTSVGFMLAAQSRGYMVEYCHVEHLYIREGSAAFSRPVRLDGDLTPFYEVGEAAPIASPSFTPSDA